MSRETDERLVALVEALLFATREPVSLRRLAEVCRVPESRIAAAVDDLRRHLEQGAHGVELAEVAGGYRLFTRREFAPQVEALLRPGRQHLSPVALETLAIIAYRQPVTRLEIEAIRGVQCEYTIRNLLERQLIREAGRRESPGRPILYATTPHFLAHFGLRDMSELPPPEAFTGTGEAAALERQLGLLSPEEEE